MTTTMMDSHPHILDIAFELRQKIYTCIVCDIQRESNSLKGNPTSQYEGLRTTCKVLAEETREAVFCFSFTSYQIPNILALRPNRNNLQNIRSVSIEIPFNLQGKYYHGLAMFLDQMQLSIQQLRIFFVGQDQKGRHTGIWGCGNKPLAHDPELPYLEDDGQDFGYQWNLLRRIAILRNLQVLQIENANIPLSQGLLYANKPYLQTLNVTCDPRSVASSLSRMSNLRRADIYRNIGVRPSRFPPVETLAIDANSASNVEGIVNGVRSTLRHFSWRVPNTGLQSNARETCTYSMTNRLMETLSASAQQLETLRLCISSRSEIKDICYEKLDLARATVELAHRLPHFTALKHLEIHATGNNYFLQQRLISCLPPGVTRLFISDRCIPVLDLVVQVQKRYFPNVNQIDKSHRESALDIIQNEPESPTVIGDLLNRDDNLPLIGGSLGFIDFEFGSFRFTHAESRICGVIRSSDWVSGVVIKLNGRLLDREHHLGLPYTQQEGQPYGIAPRAQFQDVADVESVSFETAHHSRHAGIYAAIYDVEEVTPKHLVVTRNAEELGGCFSNEWDWYFGGEQEAMQVFAREPVAVAKEQRIKPSVMDIEIEATSRCRWSSPDAGLVPVGQLPCPMLPHDWKDSV